MKKNKQISNLRYALLVVQIFILLMSSILKIGLTSILLGITVLVMVYDNYKKYGKEIRTWIYLFIGIILIVLGIAELNGYHYL